MINLDPNAERLWRLFREDVRELALERGIDAEDLLGSLDEHLAEVAGEGQLTTREIEPLVASLRDEICLEFSPGDSGEQSIPWWPIAVSLGSFVVALLSFPFLGPLLIVPSWALSMYLARGAGPQRALVAFPARVYAVALLLGIVIGVSLLPVALAADAGWLTWPWTGVSFAGLLLLAAAAAVYVMRRPALLVDRVFTPTPAFVRQYLGRRSAGYVALAGGLILIAGLLGAWYVA